jgi:hypothetical protein
METETEAATTEMETEAADASKNRKALVPA